MSEVKNREIWVDNVKVIACMLVMLGHFFQSMTKSRILPANDIFYWFNQTIYFFHVPLFFICSGYLYQKYSRVDDVRSWGRNVLKKALSLGVPYFTFSFATWLLKTMFSNSINDPIGGLFDTLFLYPTSPYWYLYALFFIFLITPTIKSKRMADIGLAISVCMKTLGIIGGGYGIQAISYILSNEIWFLIGMCLSVWKFEIYAKKMKVIGPTLMSIVFGALSVVMYQGGIQNEVVDFLMGLIACGSIIMVIAIIYNNQSPVFGYLAQYTMPIFLMHTLFAAPFRVVLLKFGIHNRMVHVVFGLAASVIGPIVAAKVMKKSKWLEFFLYPGKFVKIK